MICTPALLSKLKMWVCFPPLQYSPTSSGAGNVNNGRSSVIHGRNISCAGTGAVRIFIFAHIGFRLVIEMHRSDRRTRAHEFSKTVDADSGAITTSRRLCSRMRAPGRS